MSGYVKLGDDLDWIIAGYDDNPGIMAGQKATWFKQGKHRKAARKEHGDAVKWQCEAEIQKKRAEELAVELNPELKAISLSDRAA